MSPSKKMQIKTKNIVLAFFIALSSSLSCAAPLKFCFEDISQKPWTDPDGTGLNILLLQRVEKLLGENFVYISKPWKRCQEEVRLGILNGFFGSADSPERRKYSVFPTLADGSANAQAAIYEDKFKVYLRTHGAGSWDGKKLSSPHHPVIVQRGYLVATLMQQRGIAINDSIKSAEEGLIMLSNGHADVAVLQGMEAENMVKNDPRFKEKILNTATPYAILPLYLAINKNTYAADQKRIDAIWAAIRTERNTNEYHKQLELAGAK